jgi:guanine deaminase
MDDVWFLRRAIAISHQSAVSGGGPFGAVIVRSGQIIGEGTNSVVPHTDPTAHAEIVAIRKACQTLGTHVLDQAIIYSTCEPCPMCLAAIWWARIAEIVYSNTRHDAALIGFDDEELYREAAAPLENRRLPLRRMLADEAKLVFEAWLNNPHRVPY